MLVVKCFGGLGNQMFQYAFYNYLKLDNEDVYFDISDFQIHNHHYGFELDKLFDVIYNCPDQKKIRNIRCDSSNLLYRCIHKLLHLDIAKNNEFIEKTSCIQVNRSRMKTDVYYNGFWQNSKYISEIDSRKIFAYKEKITGRNKELLESLKGKITVSIHVRGRDYLNNDSLSGICDASFYQTAINEVLRIIPSAIFLVFSDDFEYAKSILGHLDKSIYVDWNKGENSYKDLQLMSMCNHNIIANSTFSWWAAWLNRNENKIVIMPKVWRSECDYNSLEVEGWKLI